MRRTITRFIPIVQRGCGRALCLSASRRTHLLPLLAGRLQRFAAARLGAAALLLLRPAQHVRRALRLLGWAGRAGGASVGRALALLGNKDIRQDEGGLGGAEQRFGFAGGVCEGFEGQVFVDTGL